MRPGPPSALLLLLVASGLAASQTDSPGAGYPDGARFVATLMADVAGQVEAPTLEIEVSAWTTLFERQAIYLLLAEDGAAAMARALAKRDSGRVRRGGRSWTLRWASAVDSPRGPIIRLVTDRPLLLPDERLSKLGQYPYGLIELHLEPTGKGEGWVVPAARVSVSEQGQLRVEAHPEIGDPLLLEAVLVE